MVLAILSSKMIVIFLTIIIVSLCLIFVKIKFSKQIEKVYKWSLSVLSKHKLLALVLSHGGIHIIVMVLCILGIILLYNEIMSYNVAKFNQIVYTFYGDSLKNYKLNYLSFKKDIAPRPANTYNKGDIEIDYGFKRDSIVKNNKNVIVEFEGKAYECDLASKIEYYSINEREDTIYNKKQKQKIKKRYIEEYNKISNHHKIYYSYSPLSDSVHIFSRRTDANDPLKEWASINPYHCMWIGLYFKCKPELNNSSNIRIVYNKISESSQGIRQPITLDNVYPQPTSITITDIVYSGKELETVIKQGGIYITGLDPERKREVDKIGVIYSVLIGTIAAFMLDVIVHLIIKWKNLKVNG